VGYDENQLFADVRRVAKKAEESQETREVEMLIEVLKSNLMMTVGDRLAETIATHALLRPAIGKRLTNGTEIVVQVAKCFELIARREWLGEEPG